MPIRYAGRYLVDGAVGMGVPARPLREMGATRVISVHLPNVAEAPDPADMFAVVNRCFQVMSGRLQHEWSKHSDLVISPAVAGLAWDSFEDASKLIDLGERAAVAALPVIRQWLQAGLQPITNPSEAHGRRATSEDARLSWSRDEAGHTTSPRGQEEFFTAANAGGSGHKAGLSEADPIPL